jgi:hypothetical protein
MYVIQIWEIGGSAPVFIGALWSLADRRPATIHVCNATDGQNLHGSILKKMRVQNLQKFLIVSLMQINNRHDSLHPCSHVRSSRGANQGAFIPLCVGRKARDTYALTWCMHAFMLAWAGNKAGRKSCLARFRCGESRIGRGTGGWPKRHFCFELSISCRVFLLVQSTSCVIVYVEPSELQKIRAE